jgi:hypothetical protein
MSPGWRCLRGSMVWVAGGDCSLWQQSRQQLTTLAADWLPCRAVFLALISSHGWMIADPWASGIGIALKTTAVTRGCISCPR